MRSRPESKRQPLPIHGPFLSSYQQCHHHDWKTYTARVDEGERLDLLSTPAPIRLAHILWRLNTGDELKHHVNQADYPNDRAEDDIHGVVLEQDGAAEDVDYPASARTGFRVRRERGGGRRGHTDSSSDERE